MNTSAVSKLLNVSTSTVQRWVKVLGLEPERNELAHYIFSKEDIEILTSFKEQIQTGVPLQTIISRNKIKPQKSKKDSNKLLNKLRDLEIRIDNKADSVVTYQLLQHRNEIEDLKEQIQLLNEQIEMLLAKQNETSIPQNGYELQVLSDNKTALRPKKKKLISSIFGF